MIFLKKMRESYLPEAKQALYYTGMTLYMDSHTNEWIIL